MKLYISGNDDIINDIKCDVISDINDSTDVLILPGGLGICFDMFNAINMGKNIYLYNKDMCFKSLINYLYEMYQSGYIDKAPFEYLCIESEKEELLRKIEEK